MYCTSKISQVRLTGCLVFYDILCAAIFQLLNALQFFQGVFQFMKPQSKKNLFLESIPYIQSMSCNCNQLKLCSFPLDLHYCLSSLADAVVSRHEPCKWVSRHHQVERLIHDVLVMQSLPVDRLISFLLQDLFPLSGMGTPLEPSFCDF